MYVFVAMPSRTLILADSYANALVRSLGSAARALPAAQRGGSAEPQGTTVFVVDPNERHTIDADD